METVTDFILKTLYEINISKFQIVDYWKVLSSMLELYFGTGIHHLQHGDS